MSTDFYIAFINRFTSNFPTKCSLTIPPHLKRVATLPCELSVFKKLPCSRSLEWSNWGLGE